MKVQGLMARLSELDPNDDICILTREAGPAEILDLMKFLGKAKMASGRELPKMVWCVTSAGQVLDYKELLKKYVFHLLSIEGHAFLEEGDKTGDFTDEEWQALKDLAVLEP